MIRKPLSQPHFSLSSRTREAFWNGTLPDGVKPPVIAHSSHVLGNRLCVPPMDSAVDGLSLECAGMASVAVPVKAGRYISTLDDMDADIPEFTQLQ